MELPDHKEASARTYIHVCSGASTLAHKFRVRLYLIMSRCFFPRIDQKIKVRREKQPNFQRLLTLTFSRVVHGEEALAPLKTSTREANYSFQKIQTELERVDGNEKSVAKI